MSEYTGKLTEKEMLQRLSDPVKQEYYDICNGVRYPSLMSDVIAKNCFDPDKHPERLEYLLRHVTGDSSIKVEGSFKNECGAAFTDAKKIIFDLPARLADGRLSDTDFQIHAQDFALKRGHIYGSELLTIQYSKVESQKKEEIDYDTVKEVILVFLLHDSPKEFKDFQSDRYIHRFYDYTAESGFSYKPLVKSVYVQVDKAFEQYKNGVDGEHDPDLQLLLAMMGNMNDKLVLDRVGNNPLFVGIAEHMRKLSLNKEVQVALLGEKFYEMDLNSIKNSIRREGLREGKLEGRLEGKLEVAVRIVRNGMATPEDAARLAEISSQDLEAALKEQDSIET